MQQRYGLLRMDPSAPLARPTSGCAHPDAHLGLSLSRNSEGECYPDLDPEEVIPL